MHDHQHYVGLQAIKQQEGSHKHCRPAEMHDNSVWGCRPSSSMRTPTSSTGQAGMHGNKGCLCVQAIKQHEDSHKQYRAKLLKEGKIKEDQLDSIDKNVHNFLQKAFEEAKASLLCCAALRCAVLCCAVLCCAVLCFHSCWTCSCWTCCQSPLCRST